MWPSTANARRLRASTARVLSAARIASGFALYASLITVTPSGRSVNSIRHRLRGTAADSPAAISAALMPSWPASAAAASALITLCSPCSRSATAAEPSPVTSVNLARPASSSATRSARTAATASRPKVTTRAAVPAALARTRMAHAQHYPEPRRRHLAKAGYVPGRAGGELGYQVAGLLGDAQHRERQSDFIVERVARRDCRRGGLDQLRGQVLGRGRARRGGCPR